MNRVFIIGNLTNNPDVRITQNGIKVCSFGVAVNRRRVQGQEQQADFFRVSAWRGLAENCEKYLAKGRKVAVVGSVSVSVYTASNGEARANLEVTADDVEFLTPKGEQQEQQPVQVNAVMPAANPIKPPSNDYVEVTDEELPF